MNEKELIFSDELRQKVLTGAEKVAKAVIATLGPLGRNVMIRKGPMRPPVVTKDGVTVAKEIKAFEDYYEDMGLQMVKETASKSNDAAGDGTTTATLLTYEMMKEGLDKMKSGSNAMHLRRGMQKACDSVCEQLEKDKVIVDKPEQFKAIATISSQDEEIGALVSLVVQEVGQDGAVSVESAQTLGLEYTLTEGMQLSSGWITQHFADKRDKMVAVVEEPYIFIFDERITDPRILVPVVEMVCAKNGAPLVIIAESIEAEALSLLIYNLPWIKVKGQNPNEKGDIVTLAIRAPEVGERRSQVLEDIAIKTGGRVISKKVGLTPKNIQLADLGRARRIISTEKTTTIIDGSGEATRVEDRVNTIKVSMKTAESDEQDFLKGRMANILGKVAVIKVGSSTAVEQQEKQHRVEDAVAAVRASAEEGIVAGGGTAYLRCIIAAPDTLTKDELVGWNIVMQTLKKPLWWIAQNAGFEGGMIVDTVMKKNGAEGFNAETGEYVNMIEANIIDPKKVARCALQNAVSTASTFLTVEVGVTGLPGSDPMYQ